MDRSGTNVGLFHGSLRSALALQQPGKQPHAPFEEHQVPEAGLAHALVGHFHTPRDGTWHTYPGNPEPLTFAETGDRAAVVIEFNVDGTPPVRTRHRVAHSEVHDLTVDVSGAGTVDEIRARVRERLVPLVGTARVTLVGDVQPEVTVHPVDLEGVAAHLDGLVVRVDRVGVAHDLEALAEEPTIRGRFVRDVLAADLDEDRRRRVLTIGLRALEGRTDLEVA